ncbi:hypothetical protein ATANTOWER_025245, partial [Ataeniobius toweri]|nr:hypothetical protein [Ataeniobius toweri]
NTEIFVGQNLLVLTNSAEPQNLVPLRKAEDGSRADQLMPAGIWMPCCGNTHRCVHPLIYEDNDPRSYF